MCSGFDRYYQIAKCFRDEDLRADRQPEFTQVDIEMSFADEKQVMDMAEGLMIRVFKEALGADIPAPFPRMTWDEAMSRYGVDKPDTRFGLELQDVTSIVSNSGFKLFASAKLVKAMRVPGGENLTRKEIDELTEFVKIYGSQGLAWIKIRENEWQSPIAKFLSDEERAGLTEALGLSVGDIVFFQAGEPGMVNAALGNLRVHLGEKLGLIPENAWNFLWVTDFPQFEYSKEENRYVAMHHPFTAPRDEDVDKLVSDPGHVYAKAYDMVCNGYELGGEAYISKPFHPKHLLAVVHRILTDRQSLRNYYNSAISTSDVYEGSTIDADDKKFIVQLTRTIEENLVDENLSLNFLCDKMCVSRMGLYRKIKEITQMTPSEYIRSVKLKHATHLLRTTGMTIQEIMFCSGFNNKSYFYREFAKVYRMSPKEMREKER